MHMEVKGHWACWPLTSHCIQFHGDLGGGGSQQSTCSSSSCGALDAACGWFHTLCLGDPTLVPIIASEVQATRQKVGAHANAFLRLIVLPLLPLACCGAQGEGNCFFTSNGSFCGNRLTEEGEQCDCGFTRDDCDDVCCYPKDSREPCKLKRFANAGNTTVKVGRERQLPSFYYFSCVFGFTIESCQILFLFALCIRTFHCELLWTNCIWMLIYHSPYLGGKMKEIS